MQNKPSNKITAKQWLRNVRYIDTEIRSLRTEQSRLVSIGLVSPPFSEFKPSGTPPGNSSGARFAEYVRYSELIDKRIKQLYELKENVHKAIEDVPDETSRILLREHYINFKSFSEIAALLNLSYDYVVGDLHPAALKAVKVPDKYSLNDT